MIFKSNIIAGDSDKRAYYWYASAYTKKAGLPFRIHFLRISRYKGIQISARLRRNGIVPVFYFCIRGENKWICLKH
jgi:hypothetical protein